MVSVSEDVESTLTVSGVDSLFSLGVLPRVLRGTTEGITVSILGKRRVR